MLETIQSRAFEVRLKPLTGQEAPIPESYAPDLSGKPWEDLLEESAPTRPELQEKLDMLIAYFAKRLKEVSGPAQESILEAIDLLTESKEALTANANQKLVTSRLAMQLRRVIPAKAGIHGSSGQAGG